MMPLTCKGSQVQEVLQLNGGLPGTALGDDIGHHRISMALTGKASRRLLPNAKLELLQKNIIKYNALALCFSEVMYMYPPKNTSNCANDLFSFRQRYSEAYSIRQLYRNDDNERRPCHELPDLDLRAWREDPGYVVDTLEHKPREKQFKDYWEPWY